MQERRRLLADLRRKYGADLAAVMAFAEEAAARLDELENAEARAAQLRGASATSGGRAGGGRGEGAGPPGPGPRREFGALVGERLADLAMAGARVEIRVGTEGTGEPIEIALGANVGEAVLPLAKAASGGELARAMLAIRLVAMGGPQTMVFDEVDAGVGGAAALSLGAALHEVSRTRQVLVVTHLAQVAAKADRQITRAQGRGGRPDPHLGHASGGRGAGGRAVPHAVGPSRQRRRRATPDAEGARSGVLIRTRRPPHRRASIIVEGCTDQST